jgi:hypothetical protein
MSRIQKTIIALSTFVLVAVAPSPAAAWGIAAHRYIMARAIERLPAELKPFFEHYLDELVVRVVDPDMWRNAGWEEDQNHFLDFGVKDFGPYPFTALPREYGAAIEKFGMATLKRYGLLPWREAEEFGNLRRAFEGFASNSPFAPTDTVLFAAAAAHYIQDAHQPLHATNNYDGQLTEQNGVHSRFETALFERFAAKLTVNPGPVSPITNPRDVAFDVLLASYQLVDPLLKADKEAIAGKDTYDDDYFDKFFARVRPMLEKRLADSVTATASMIVGAWELAGKPQPRIEMPPTVQKVRTPKSE